MADAFFRISVIDGALNIHRYRQKYPHISLEDSVRQLQNGPAHLAGYDYRRAVDLGNRIGWEVFHFKGDRQSQLRETLMQLAMRLKPFWARFSHFGRQRVLELVSKDQRQLLELAGLLVVPPPEAVVNWWDKMGSFFRTEENQRNVEIGRAGERMTMDYETQRLKDEGILKKPVWIALEDNHAGYDVLSYKRRRDGGIDELRIETKTSSYSPTHFILTRPEWDKALRVPDFHIFHVWNLGTKELTIISVPEMALNIPKDNGFGSWREVKVLLS